ncbi:MAG: FAD-dependent oxidoreductase [Acidimicrobiales bacterium]|nr:FAD-dependent oxidoreductase [Acidimicrobiales bacterium]
MNSLAREHESSFWWYDLDQRDRQTVRAPLGGDVDCDVVVVGAGYTGLWTAHSLLSLDPTMRVVVLDQWVAGAGASSRNGGWCSGLLPLGWDDLARRYGREATVAFQREADRTVDEVLRVAADEGIDAGIAKGGYLCTAANSVQLASLRQQLDEARRWGRSEDDLRMLDATEARSMIGAARVEGGLFTPHCAAVQPAKLVRGLASAVERRGGVLHDHTRVLAIEPGRVVAEHGTVRAPVVVRATEGYTAALPGQRRRLVPMYTSMIATEPLPASFWASVGWSQRATFNDARRVIFYAQRTADDRIAIGRPGPRSVRFGSALGVVGDEASIEVGLRATLTEQFPDLAEVRIDHRWGGVVGVPRDWTPSVTFDRSTGLATAGGYTGDGVALTNLAGRTVADLVLGRDTDLVRLPWTQHRGRSWEPEPLRFVGATAGSRLARAADERELRTDRPARLLGALAGRLTGH